MHQPTITRRVRAFDVASLEHLLNSTVEAIIPDALVLNQGIRVTRLGPGDYTVEADPGVQCGYTIYDAR